MSKILSQNKKIKGWECHLVVEHHHWIQSLVPKREGGNGPVNSW